MFNKNDFEVIKKCPWCGSIKFKRWGIAVRKFKSVRCEECGLIFVQNRLNEKGRLKYLSNYIYDVHQADPTLNKKREEMYKVELDFVSKYLISRSKVLDVGCSGGYFLNHFKNRGFECYGVEVDPIAAREAMKKHKVWCGKLPKLEIDETFDLIIFRGVLQYLPFPKLYLAKAVSLLNQNGLIFITSTPNSDSFCCRIFKEQWNSHEPEGHLLHFNKNHFDKYFENAGMVKLNEYYFYEETPYADVNKDILKVAKAIQLNNMKRKINFRSPPFWMNMMSLLYAKRTFL